MENKVLNRIIATLIVIVLTVSDWGLLASSAYAAYEELEKQKTQTDNKNVEFDAYFKESEKTHSLNLPKDKEGKIYIKLNVENGYLKQSKISLDNPNFSVEEKELQLGQISGEKEIEIPFHFEKQEQISIDYFNRESTVNLIATYIDSNGKEKEISGTIKIHLNWEENVSAKIEQQIEKVISLDNQRTLVQVKVKDYIEENSVPSENTKLEIKTLKPENSEIENVAVYATKTIGASGKEDEVVFTKDNWSYNKEEEKITINIEKTRTEENKISWKDGEDEFKIIYIIKSEEPIENKEVKLYAKGEIKYADNIIAFEEEKNANLIMSGNLINSELSVSENINKGYIYSYSDETTFETKIQTEISYNDLIQGLNINFEKDKFINKNGEQIETNEIIYKKTQISKKEFDNIFGEEGKLEIYNNGEKIAEINKESKVDEQGNIIIEYGKEIGEIEIITSKPQTEGRIEITNIKAIKAKTMYDIETIKSLNKIKTKAKVKTNITEEEKEREIELKETISKAELVMGENNLSTVVKNENVEIRVIFRTDSNKYDLYKNPKIEIELPKQIKEAKVKSIEAAFGEGFKLKGYEIIENEEGKKVIKVELEGEQTKYAIDISKGMSIIIKTDMILDKKSGSSEETVKLRYTNEKAITGYENGGEEEAKVKIEAPKGVVAVNGMSKYNKEEETVTSLSSKEQTGELEILTEKKEAKMTIDIINNYEKEIINPSIIGRIPFEGNKKETGENLGSTFTAKVIKGLEKIEGLEGEKYKIYYSSNGEATEEIEKVENGWKENIEEVGEVKSYLVKLENYKMKQGEIMSFTYGVEIPEGLNHNESAYGTYAVGYGIEEEGTIREEKIVAPTVGATTGPGPELEVSLEADIENNAEVEEEQIIKYSVKVKNIGQTVAKNINAKAEVPENLTYVKYKPASGNGFDTEQYIPNGNIEEFSDTIEELQAGETKTTNFYAQVETMPYIDEELEEDLEDTYIEQTNNNIKMRAKVTAEDLGKEIETNEYQNTRVQASLDVSLSSIYDDKIVLTVGDKVIIYALVTNPTETETKNNVVLTYVIPEGYDYKSAEILDDIETENTQIAYNEQTRTLTVTAPKLEESESFALEIILDISEFKTGETRRDLANVMSIKSNEMDKSKNSNIIKHIAGSPVLEAVQTSNKDKYVGIGEEIEYIVTIKNTGIASAKEVKIEDIMPEELEYLGTKYQTAEGSGESNNTLFKGCITDIPSNSEAIFTIKAKAKKLDKETVKITNNVKITAQNMEEISVNPLTQILLNEKKVVDSQGNTVNVHTVSGTAWEDSNKDGKRDSKEAKLANIEVILIDNSTGNIATKVTSNSSQRTFTNSNGEYKFDEVKDGNYIVAFLYDTSKYTITEYKKSGVLESENSDAVKAEIKLDGGNKIAGVTETFNIDTSISAIDIGLTKIESAVFGIDKVVTKMMMQNTKTSKTVEFKDSKLAKMDVDGKYINDTNLVMEYKIRVKNESNVEGYVKKIVDHVPTEFKFSTDLNKNWYLGSNGDIYNTSLANTIIKPGETKEVTLVLTKKMNESGNGIVHNTAEITEVYNEYGVENIINNDTTRGAADIIIGIKTGREIAYISLIFVILAFIGTGIYFVNNQVFNKVINKKLKYLDDED